LLLTSNPSVGPAGDGPCGLAVRFSVGLAGSLHWWIDLRAYPASPAPLGCSSPDTRSRDRPCGAPLVRFCPLQRSPATPRLRRFSYPMMPLIGRCRFGVRRPALLAPRVRPALPQPIRPPMRFFARRPRRDPRPEGAGVPVIRGRRRHGSCVVSIHRRRRSATRTRSAWPGRDFPQLSRRRSWGSSLRSVAPAREASGGVVRPVVSHLPFRERLPR